MAASDLASLQDVKDWLAGGGPTLGSADNNLIGRLITAASGGIYSYLSRSVIIPQVVTERYDGQGNPRLLLRNYPVLSLGSLVVDGSAVVAGSYPAGSTGAGWPPGGYLFSPWDGLPPGKPQALDLWADSGGASVNHRSFPRGRQNVQVTYLCGYQVVGEAAVVPAQAPYAVPVQAPQGPWASDGGVAYAAGGSLAAVVGTPSKGQYVPPSRGVNDEDDTASYTFSSADAGESVLISYGYVPSVVGVACVEWVAERYRYRQRIGQKAQTVAGQQTASYDTSGVPDYVKQVLGPYRNVVPSMSWY